MTLAQHGDSSENRDRNRIGRKSHVEHQRVRANLVKEEQPGDAQQQRDDRKIAQKIGARLHAQPQQHSRFNQPSDGDPLRVQFQGNGNGDERDGDGHVQQVNECGIFLAHAILDGAAEAQVDRRQRQRIPGERGFFLLIHDVQAPGKTPPH